MVSALTIALRIVAIAVGTDGVLGERCSYLFISSTCEARSSDLKASTKAGITVFNSSQHVCCEASGALLTLRVPSRA